MTTVDFGSGDMQLRSNIYLKGCAWSCTLLNKLSSQICTMQLGSKNCYKLRICSSGILSSSCRIPMADIKKSCAYSLLILFQKWSNFYQVLKLLAVTYLSKTYLAMPHQPVSISCKFSSKESVAWFWVHCVRRNTIGEFFSNAFWNFSSNMHCEHWQVENRRLPAWVEKMNNHKWREADFFASHRLWFCVMH